MARSKRLAAGSSPRWTTQNMAGPRWRLTIPQPGRNIAAPDTRAGRCCIPTIRETRAWRRLSPVAVAVQTPAVQEGLQVVGPGLGFLGHAKRPGEWIEESYAVRRPGGTGFGLSALGAVCMASICPLAALRWAESRVACRHESCRIGSGPSDQGSNAGPQTHFTQACRVRHRQA